jgi:hypothetical protein
MEKLRIEKIRAAWNEFESVLQQVEHSGNMSKLDAELLKSKLLAAYEALTIQSDRSDSIQASQEEAPDNLKVQPITTHGGKIRKEEDLPEKRKGNQATGPVIEKSNRVLVNEEIQDKIKETTSKETEPLNRTGEVIGEKLRGSRKFVHDELAEKVQAGRQDLSSALQAKPIENIEKAIGINDKFLFIKELFRNNGQLYKETVEKLDTSKTLDEALRHLHEGFNWDEKDPVVQKFTDIVRRRHQ